MTHCPNCGAPNEEGVAFCGRCGTSLRADAPGFSSSMPPRPPADTGLDSNEKTLIFFGNLCISPILGIVLYFVWKDSKPRRASDVCSVTLWTLGAYVIVFALAMCAAVVGGMAEAGAT